MGYDYEAALKWLIENALEYVDPTDGKSSVVGGIPLDIPQEHLATFVSVGASNCINWGQFHE